MKHLKWIIAILILSMLMATCLSNHKQEATITNIARDTTWTYYIPMGGMAFVDTECYRLIEGYLDDTAHLEYKETVPFSKFINNKQIHYDYTYHHRMIIPKGPVKIHIHWQYATTLTYLYKPYKAKKGHLKITSAEGYFNASKDWTTPVNMVRLDNDGVPQN